MHQRCRYGVLDDFLLHVFVVLAHGILVRVDARVFEPPVHFRYRIAEPIWRRLLLGVEIEVQNTVGIFEEDADDEADLLTRAGGGEPGGLFVLFGIDFDADFCELLFQDLRLQNRRTGVDDPQRQDQLLTVFLADATSPRAPAGLIQKRPSFGSVEGWRRLVRACPVEGCAWRQHRPRWRAQTKVGTGDDFVTVDREIDRLTNTRIVERWFARVEPQVTRL